MKKKEKGKRKKKSILGQSISIWISDQTQTQLHFHPRGAPALEVALVLHDGVVVGAHPPLVLQHLLLVVQVLSGA